jgi:hypothetical protein
VTLRAIHRGVGVLNEEIRSHEAACVRDTHTRTQLECGAREANGLRQRVGDAIRDFKGALLVPHARTDDEEFVAPIRPSGSPPRTVMASRSATVRSSSSPAR